MLSFSAADVWSKLYCPNTSIPAYWAHITLPIKSETHFKPDQRRVIFVHMPTSWSEKDEGCPYA